MLVFYFGIDPSVQAASVDATGIPTSHVLTGRERARHRGCCKPDLINDDDRKALTTLYHDEQSAVQPHQSVHSVPWNSYNNPYLEYQVTDVRGPATNNHALATREDASQPDTERYGALKRRQSS
jgi:hypothetical protein